MISALYIVTLIAIALWNLMSDYLMPEKVEINPHARIDSSLFATEHVTIEATRFFNIIARKRQMKRWKRILAPGFCHRSSVNVLF